MTVQIRRLATTQSDFKNQLANVLAFEEKEDESINSVVANVLGRRQNQWRQGCSGVHATFRPPVRQLRCRTGDIENRLRSSARLTDAERRAALQAAANRIRKYHEYQKRSCGSDGFTFTDEDGTSLGPKGNTLDSVGNLRARAARQPIRLPY